MVNVEITHFDVRSVTFERNLIQQYEYDIKEEGKVVIQCKGIHYV